MTKSASLPHDCYTATARRMRIAAAVVALLDFNIGGAGRRLCQQPLVVGHKSRLVAIDLYEVFECCGLLRHRSKLSFKNQTFRSVRSLQARSEHRRASRR